MSEQPYLLDALETSDMLVIDGLHAFDFQLDDELLDQACLLYTSPSPRD